MGLQYALRAPLQVQDITNCILYNPLCSYRYLKFQAGVSQRWARAASVSSASTECKLVHSRCGQGAVMPALQELCDIQVEITHRYRKQSDSTDNDEWSTSLQYAS